VTTSLTQGSRRLNQGGRCRDSRNHDRCAGVRGLVLDLANGTAPRGGAYTNDWIENLLGLDMHSTDRVLPEYQ
jgi:hypothetical protein